MTVSSEQSRVQYATDGVATSFPVPFRFLQNRDLRVTLVDSEGNEQELSLDTDYSVAGAGQQSGGTLTTTAAYPAGQALLIDRIVSITQETAYQRNDPFPERAHERALDKLTMICQMLASIFGLTPGSVRRALLLGEADQDGQGAYRANGNRIQNLGKPKLTTDAARLSDILDAVSQLSTDGTGQFVVERLKDSIDPDNGTGMIGHHGQPLPRRLIKTVYADTDYGVLANGIDQTDKLDAMLDFLRERPDCVGVLPDGEIVVSANKTKTVGDRTIRYALDISGVNLRGSHFGYRGSYGTQIRTTNGGVALYQEKPSSKYLKCVLNSISVRGATWALWLTYSVNSEIKNFSFRECDNGIKIGDYNYDAGALSNLFENCTGNCELQPLSLEGKEWNNGNTFINCFFTGKVPSEIHVNGGHGAVSNLFIGTEFASPAGGSAGIILGRSRGTTFLNGYFEAQGPSIVLRHHAASVFAVNCTYAVTRNDNSYGQPSFIYHEGAVGSASTASITIQGGWVSANPGPQYNNLIFIDGNGASGLTVNLEGMPISAVQSTGFVWMKPEFVYSLLALRGSFGMNIPVRFGSTSATFQEGDGFARGRLTAMGKSIQYSVEIRKGAGTSFEGGNIILLAPVPTVTGATVPRQIGNLLITYVEDGVARRLVGSCSMNRTSSPSTISLFRHSPSTSYLLDATASWFNGLPEGAIIVMDFVYEV
ncbi:hypothetical protein [Alcaligenes aquatilis]|uniref:right-handed parallel beta-helix repeat-containing protein n=1 Tax=Alcaligenes aquatilis TaxID=323284 RepID=UPI003F90F234